MRKTARPVVWEGAGAQSPALDPIKPRPCLQVERVRWIIEPILLGEGDDIKGGVRRETLSPRTETGARAEDPRRGAGPTFEIHGHPGLPGRLAVVVRHSIVR